MAERTLNGSTLDRRGFLKGSALFAAAAVGLGVVPAFAQEPQNKPAVPEEEPKKPAEPSGEEAKKQPPAKQDPDKLYDKNGREYRVCERCGGNMYKEGDTWTCEQCGLSYVE